MNGGNSLMLKKILFLALVVGSFSFISKNEASAQCVGGGGVSNVTCSNESMTTGSALLGFDPSGALMTAVTNTNPALGPCFTCPNTNAGGTTAGALTNSMFGTIRLNNNADLGDQSFNASVQGMVIPTATSCSPAPCNDSGAFTFSMPIPTQNFLAEGTAIVTNPSAGTGVTVGQAGVSMGFTNDFTYNANGSSSFNQTVLQSTFTGGQAGNDLQVIRMQADAVNQANTNPSGGGGTVNYSQDITEGGFILGPFSGSFNYNTGLAFNAANGFAASAPTGAGGATTIPGN